MKKVKEYKKLEYDCKTRKYFLKTENHQLFLSCGTKVKFKLDDEEKIGTIEYSNFISRGYYISLNEGKSYIPLFSLIELSLDIRKIFCTVYRKVVNKNHSCEMSPSCLTCVESIQMEE